MNAFNEAKKKINFTAIYISHDLALVKYVCERTIVMYLGSIVEDGPTDEVVKNPLHPYTKALMKSIPHLETKTDRLIALKGMVPSLLEMGDGCKFCNRFEPEECPCKGTKLNYELFMAAPNHYVRCNKELLNG